MVLLKQLFTTFFIFPSFRMKTFFNKLQSIADNILSKENSKISKVFLCSDHCNFLSVFSPGRSFTKCYPVTQSSNLIIEIDKVICIDVGVYVFYMCLYVYICLYKYVLFALVCACLYLHIFTYSFGSYRGLIKLHFVLWSPLSLHCHKY